jgi:hypothetical protein
MPSQWSHQPYKSTFFPTFFPIPRHHRPPRCNIVFFLCNTPWLQLADTVYQDMQHPPGWASPTLVNMACKVFIRSRVDRPESSSSFRGDESTTGRTRLACRGHGWKGIYKELHETKASNNKNKPTKTPERPTQHTESKKERK